MSKNVGTENNSGIIPSEKCTVEHVIRACNRLGVACQQQI